MRCSACVAQLTHRPLLCVSLRSTHAIKADFSRSTVKIIRSIRFAYLAYFSQPPADRLIFRFLRRRSAKSIVEVGLSDPNRTLRMLEVAQMFQSKSDLRYAAIDLFEGHPTSGLALKRAHQLFSPQVQQLRLVPGDPLSALSRCANTLLGTDLLIIHAHQDQAALTQAWLYVPRMLHEHSMVFIEEPLSGQPDTKFRQLTPADVEQLAATQRRTARRAA